MDQAQESDNERVQSPLADAASRLELDLIGPENLPAVAADALTDGYDSPSLRILAGLSKPDAREARGLFDGALAELDIPPPSQEDAVMFLARQVSKEIIDGTTSPYQGAKRISEICLRASEVHLPQLDTFVYAESEWGERPNDSNLFAEGVVAAAKELTGE